MEEQVREGIPDRELNPEVAKQRNLLFEKYVNPYLNMVYKLCVNYTYNPANIEENYTEVLANFYRRIETYNPDLSILTWLHIITKRQIAEIEKRRKRHDNKDYDQDIEMYIDDVSDGNEPGGNIMDAKNYRELYSDDILFVLDRMKSLHRDAFLLQEAGYSLKEIAEIEFNRGTLKSRNIETVKSRLFLARQFLKNNLTRDGRRKAD
ncbi:MAG: RNA polymerase sigma factor [Prevotella sp.]|jgi:RNA polymerase sigma factor (sigma-70 family)|nr:RNA polymerase sigma factor [Prevotella sp.]